MCIYRASKVITRPFGSSPFLLKGYRKQTQENGLDNSAEKESSTRRDSILKDRAWAETNTEYLVLSRYHHHQSHLQRKPCEETQLSDSLV